MCINDLDFLQFYEACKNFDIVEKYNEHLRYLRLDEFSIPANPFGPKELEQWMKVTALQFSESAQNVLLC